MITQSTHTWQYACMLGKKNIIDLDILDGPQLELELELARARQGPFA